MRRILKWLAGLLVILMAVVIIVPFVIPVDMLKDKAIAQIELMTGRKVRMGKIKLSVFPNIALTARNVALSNPSWLGETDMVAVEELRLGVELLPLLQKKVHVKELTLESPVVGLVKRGGEANWEFKPVPSTDEKAAPPSPTKGDATPADVHGSPLPSLDKIAIRNGTFTYDDSGSGTKTFSKVDLTLESPNLEEKLKLDFHGLLDGKQVGLAVFLGKPLGLMRGGASEAGFDVTFGELKANWKGTLSMAGLPEINGELNIPELDTSKLGGGAGMKAPGKASAAPVAARWSDEPIALDALGAVNADLGITIGKLVTPKLSLSNIKAKLTLKNGALKLVTDELALFGGAVQANLGASKAGAVSAQLKLGKIDMHTLLKEMKGEANLNGTLNGQVDLAAKGTSQRAMVSSLSGKGNISLTDGTIRGVSFIDMARNVTSSFHQNEGGTTDFKRVSGSFTAAGGVISNRDLLIDSSVMNFTGAGEVDLPAWQVRYVLTPQVNVGGVEGATVPIRIEGPLDSPSYRPDLQNLLREGLKNPEKLKENLKDAKEMFKNKEGLKNGLQNLLR